MAEDDNVRSPWLSGIICFLLCVIVSPAFAMFYLNRGWAGVGYLVVQILSIILFFGYIGDNHPITQLLHPFKVHVVFMIVMTVICMVHSTFIILTTDDHSPLKWYANSTGLFALLAIPIFSVLLARAFLFQPFHIPSGSMRPTLLVGDYIFVNKYAYGYNEYTLPFNLPFFAGRKLNVSPQRGEVIVFKQPTNVTVDYVKRVVGLPGDTIQMIDGRLYINDQPVGISKEGSFQIPDERRVDLFKETLPNNVSYNILDHGARFGDNTRKYTVPQDHFFVLGDNRDQSNDSRNPHDIGFISRDLIVGPVSVIWWNSKKRAFSWRGVTVD